MALCRTPFWNEATEEGQAALLDAAQQLETHGFRIEEVALPDGLASMNDCHIRLMAYEAARNFIFEYEAIRRGKLGKTTCQSIESGWHVTPDQYLSIRADVRQAKNTFATFCDGFDAVMVPAAPGEAPLISGTGNSIFNRMWTLLGVPAITIPVATGSQGLPIGIQLVGKIDTDLALMDLCRQMESVLEIASIHTST